MDAVKDRGAASGTGGRRDVNRRCEALDECLEVVEALLEAGADVHRRYRVDIDGEILELTPLTYRQKLASLFPDKPFNKVTEVLLRDR